jgi:hypothetical protein
MPPILSSKKLTDASGVVALLVGHKRSPHGTTMVDATVLHFDFDHERKLCYCCEASVSISFPLHTMSNFKVIPHNGDLKIIPKLNGDTSSDAFQDSGPPNPLRGGASFQI